MTKKAAVWICLAFVLAMATVALAAEVKCPTCGLTAVFTGRSHSDSGVLWNQYRCPRQHLFWVKAN
jgi:predicted RNA-binding Zn-ribbon protein involved in translation (DUF1610 family)